MIVGVAVGEMGLGCRTAVGEFGAAGVTDEAGSGAATLAAPLFRAPESTKPGPAALLIPWLVAEAGLRLFIMR